MKIPLILMALTVLAATPAVAQSGPVQSRTFQQYGGMVTSGQDSGLSAANWGASARSFTYFDAAQPEGFYYAVLSGAIIHSVDAVPFADLRLVDLGWRGNPFTALGQSSPWDFGLDLGLAPTVELRLKPNEIALASESIGIGTTLGVYFPVGDWGDLGLSWEPVVGLGLLAWGNTNVRNANYSDFVLSWVVKSASETRPLVWKKAGR